MTVKELIDILSKQEDQEAMVMVGEAWNNMGEATEVKAEQAIEDKDSGGMYFRCDDIAVELILNDRITKKSIVGILM